MVRLSAFKHRDGKCDGDGDGDGTSAYCNSLWSESLLSLAVSLFSSDSTMLECSLPIGTPTVNRLLNLRVMVVMVMVMVSIMVTTMKFSLDHTLRRVVFMI